MTQQEDTPNFNKLSAEDKTLIDMCILVDAMGVLAAQLDGGEISAMCLSQANPEKVY